MEYGNILGFSGFHDPTEDEFDREKFDFQRLRRQDVNPRARDQKEAVIFDGSSLLVSRSNVVMFQQERRKDKDKLKKRKEEELPESIFKAQPEKKRSKLVLPKPQISDKELEDVRIALAFPE